MHPQAEPTPTASRAGIQCREGGVSGSERQRRRQAARAHVLPQPLHTAGALYPWMERSELADCTLIESPHTYSVDGNCHVIAPVI